MKIALVCDWYLPRIGGIERHLSQLAEHLSRAGHEVTVVTPFPGRIAPQPGVRVERVPATLLPGAALMWSPPAFRRLGRTLREGGFDVVHAHASLISPAAFATLAHSSAAGIPVLCTLHSILGGFGGFFRRLDRWCRWTEWPVAYSAVSERVARDLGPLLPGRTVEILSNAVNPAEWVVPAKARGKRLVLTSVMRLVRRKRADALLRAFQRAQQQLPVDRRIELRLIGDGPERPRLQRLAAQLGLATDVRFLGARPPAEIRTELAESDGFVLASTLEAFGIAALEARAAGLPVIARRESGVSEFITDHVDGLLADDDAQLADHLAWWARNDEGRDRIQAHNRRTPVTFTWEHTLELHLAAYQRARQVAAARDLPLYPLTSIPAAAMDGESRRQAR